MDTAALIAWIITALAGLYLLATWLFYGGIRQRKTATTSFPPLLIFGHFLLAASGLVTWIAYVLTGVHTLAWAASIGLLIIATFGCIMFVRWGGEAEKTRPVPIPATPAPPDGLRRYPAEGSGIAAAFGQGRGHAHGPVHGAVPSMKSRVTTMEERAGEEPPAESHFPIAVVACHGAFAICTFILVLLATLGVGG